MDYELLEKAEDLGDTGRGITKIQKSPPPPTPASGGYLNARKLYFLPTDYPYGIFELHN